MPGAGGERPWPQHQPEPQTRPGSSQRTQGITTDVRKIEYSNGAAMTAGSTAANGGWHETQPQAQGDWFESAVGSVFVGELRQELQRHFLNVRFSIQGRDTGKTLIAHLETRTSAYNLTFPPHFNGGMVQLTNPTNASIQQRILVETISSSDAAVLSTKLATLLP